MQATNSLKDTPVYIELMGHNKVAAICSEAYGGMLRLDIPKTDNCGPFTQFIMPNSIYRMTIVSLETMQLMANKLEVKPLEAWEIRSYTKTLVLNERQDITDDDDFPI